MPDCDSTCRHGHACRQCSDDPDWPVEHRATDPATMSLHVWRDGDDCYLVPPLDLPVHPELTWMDREGFYRHTVTVQPQGGVL